MNEEKLNQRIDRLEELILEVRQQVSNKAPAPEYRLNALEDLVLHMSHTLTSALYILQQAAGWKMDGEERELRDEINDRRQQYKARTRGLFLRTNQFPDVPFFRKITTGKNKGQRVPSGAAGVYNGVKHTLNTRLTTILMKEGYESLHDLDGISIRRIFHAPGFGPAAIRDFQRFLVDLGVLRWIDDKDPYKKEGEDG